MEENMERAIERLSEFIRNTTCYIQPTYDATVVEMYQYLSSFEWEKLKKEWLACGQQGLQIAHDTFYGMATELQRLQNNVVIWLQENVPLKVEEMLKIRNQLPCSNLTLWTAFLLILAIIWITASSRNKAKSKKQEGADIKIEDQMFLSLCNLAKTSYIKADAREVINVVDALHIDPNYSLSGDKMTLFLCACLGGSTGLVNFLWKRGGDVRSRNAHGDTCLHLAVFATSGSRYPTKRLVEILLKNGAEANGQNMKGDTPLHIAAMTNDTHMIQLLMLYGANPSISNTDDILPIHIAANAGFMSAAKLLMVKLEKSDGWREGDTPPKATIGLLSPEKAHLVMSSQPKRMAYSS